jgi:beta-lactam-binding protein with PASTA domain
MIGGRAIKLGVLPACLLGLCALILALTSGTAVAASCPSLDNIAFYSGQAGLGYVRSILPPGVSDGNGGKESLSIDHVISGMAASDMTPDAAGLDFTGDASGGNVLVADAYADTDKDNHTTTASQDANGTNSEGEISISFDASSCTYTVDASYTMPTQGSGDWPGATDGAITDDAVSPAMPIPSDLHLTSGNLKIEAYPIGPPDIAGIEAGFYNFGPMTSWAREMARITGVDEATGDIGQASLNWDLTPSLKVKQKFCMVPDVVGQPLATAKAAITQAKCTVGAVTNEPSATVPAGDVISSDPDAETVEPVGTAVALLVSSGPQCTVPAVAGLTLAAATTALPPAHCAAGAVTMEFSDTVPKGTVISSSPPAGTVGPAGTKVALTVSKGKKPKKKCVVPHVVGRKLAAAEAAMPPARCAVGRVTKAFSNSVAKGKVISSDPTAGTTHAEGTKVSLVVSKGKPKKKKKCVVPKLVGKKLPLAKTALKKAQCAVGAITRKNSNTVTKNKVISSKPKAGTVHPAGTKVKLTVSKGKKKAGAAAVAAIVRLLG